MKTKGEDDKGARPLRDSIQLELAVEEWKKDFRDRAFKRHKPQTYAAAFRDGWNANAKCGGRK